MLLIIFKYAFGSGSWGISSLNMISKYYIPL